MISLRLQRRFKKPGLITVQSPFTGLGGVTVAAGQSINSTLQTNQCQLNPQAYDLLICWLLGRMFGREGIHYLLSPMTALLSVKDAVKLNENQLAQPLAPMAGVSLDSTLIGRILNSIVIIAVSGSSQPTRSRINDSNKIFQR